MLIFYLAMNEKQWLMKRHKTSLWPKRFFGFNKIQLTLLCYANLALLKRINFYIHP